MKKRIIIKTFVLVMILLPFISFGQQNSKGYTIRGEMSNDSLRFTRSTINKLYLARMIDEVETVIDSCNVVDRKFTFSGVAPDILDVAFIKGFDNGSIQVFIEPGEIEITPFDAKFPISAVVQGTKSNNLIRDYNNLMNSYTDLALRESKKLNSFFESPDNKLSEDEIMDYQRAVFHVNSLRYKTATMQFLKDNLDKTASLFIIKYNIVPVFSSDVIENVYLSAVPQNLRKHPLYKEMSNQIKASNLKEGSQAPDIDGKTPEGESVSLSDLRGKYVLLDFWASWCAPCRREMPFVKEALKISEEYNNFVVLSYSIDSKENDWKSCIEKNDYKHKNWIHVSTLGGWNTPAARLFNASAVPYTVLIDKDGNVIAFNIRGEEMVKKVTNLMKGIE